MYQFPSRISVCRVFAGQRDWLYRTSCIDSHLGGSTIYSEGRVIECVLYCYGTKPKCEISGIITREGTLILYETTIPRLGQ